MERIKSKTFDKSSISIFSYKQGNKTLYTIIALLCDDNDQYRWMNTFDNLKDCEKEFNEKSDLIKTIVSDPVALSKIIKLKNKETNHKG